MEYILAMTFLTEKGVKSNMNISGIKPDLTQTQVNALMETIVQKNIFTTTTGSLVSKSTAHITQKSVTKIDIV